MVTNTEALRVPEGFHEGDMADEVAEYLYFSMPTPELLVNYGQGTLDLKLCRSNLEAEVKSWPPEKIRKHWFNIQGETNGS